MEKKTLLYFRDDNKFEFRKMPLQFSCFLEKKGDAIKRAWRHSYTGQYSFPGYKNISADTITLGFARDIFLDPHNKIPATSIGDTSGKPVKEKVKEWIAQIAENQRQVYRAKRQGSGMHDYINYCLMGTIFFMLIGWLIRYATGGG